MRTRWFTAALLACVLFVAACSGGSFEAPEMQGPAAMVDDAGKPRLWLITKQEEHRQVSVGGGTRWRTNWRTDTFFHFDLQAIDPASTRTLWKQRLLTLGDPQARGTQPSRVVGSAVDAKLLGQDGAVVWLLIGDAPFGISAADGRVVGDVDTLQKHNPTLNGLLPSEGKFYGFDRGLVLTTADARRFVVRGPQQQAEEYVPPPPPVGELGPLKANGSRELVPMRPIGPDELRNATLGGEWLGLYSPAEAAYILDDSWGRTLRWPYSVTNEGAMARRQFLRARIETKKNFDDSYQRIAELTPVAGAPTFLKGRFFRQPGNSDAALVLDDPEGLLVWHSTRMDSAGRLALARLDSSLKVVWDSPLPLSESDFIRRVPTWMVPGHVVAVGELQTQDDGGVTHRDDYLVSIELATGKVVSRQLNALE